MRREGEGAPHLLLLLCTPVQHSHRAGPPFQRQLPMWQEALWTRGRYLLEKNDGGECAEGPDGLGDGFPSFQGEAEGEKPQDWLYESYYRMSQQHPLIVFLLLIVMGTCLALLAVFFASGLVSEAACPEVEIMAEADILNPLREFFPVEGCKKCNCAKFQHSKQPKKNVLNESGLRSCINMRKKHMCEYACAQVAVERHF